MERIHIVGLGPRTGTTLLAEAMVACFEIDGFDEHEASVSHLRRDAEIYLSKRPGDILMVRPRLNLDRHFHVICAMRDPRDMVTSRHGAAPERYWAPLRLWKQRLAAARRLMPHARFILVRYEDLVAAPDATQDEIARRLPFLRKKESFSCFHLRAAPSKAALTALGGLRAINTGRIGTWRSELPRLAGQLARHGPITADLIALGYEKDDGWLSALNAIAPDHSPSQMRDAATWRTALRTARARARASLSLCILATARLAGRKIG